MTGRKIRYSDSPSAISCMCKVIPQQAKVAQGVPGRLRPWIFLTFGTTRVVGRQPYAPAVFTPGKITGTHFERLSRPQGTWLRRREPRKKSPVTPPGIDHGTVRLVAQCLNNYANPGPTTNYIILYYIILYYIILYYIILYYIGRGM